MIYGLTRLALGYTDETLATFINVFWSCYNLVMLSVVIEAATYTPPPNDLVPNADTLTAATAHGRITGGSIR
jgi:hypothetical protein